MTSVKDALGDVTSYTYVQSGGRSNGLMQTQTDPLGHVTSYAYDASRRLTQVTDALNELTTYTYDAAGNQATVKDALGHVTTFAYDARRRLTQTTDATGGIATMQCNALGELTKSVDAAGNTTTYAYDGHGLMTSETDAAGSSVQRQLTRGYDGLGRMTTSTDGLSHTTTYAYDPVGRSTTTTNALGGVATNTYDLAGELLSRTDELGTVTTYAYDKRSRTTKVVEANGSSVQRTATMVYDSVGNLLSETTGIASSNQQKVTTSYAYDALNRQTKVIEAYGSSVQRTATLVFDAAGNLTSETTGIASSNAQQVTTSYSYDALNRQNQVIEAYNTGAQRTTTMIFDKAGNLLSETSGQSSTGSYAHALTTSYAYDAANRQTNVIEAYGTSLQRTTTTVYDIAGRVSTVTDPLGHTTSYAYDALNRRTQVVEAVGTSAQRTATMIYDAADNLTSETTGQSSNGSYAHQVTTSYAYDALNRRTKTLDAYGDTAQTTSTVIYDAVGNVTSETSGYSSTSGYSNPVTTSYAYDALYRATATIDAYGTSIQRTTTTVYDSADNVLQSIDAAGNTTTYAYDALNRQTTVQTPAGGTVTMVYDSADNLLAQTDQLGHTTSHAYDALNRETVTTDARGGLTTYTYDAQGNQLTLTDPVANKTTFSYDTLNRLTQQTDPLGHSATFAYNAGDLLTSTTDRNSKVRNLSYDALNRKTGETWVVSGSTVNTQTFTYDAADNQLTAQDANGAYTMAYDTLNRMTNEQEPFGQVLTFSYDAASNRTQVQDSQSGYTTSVYDALGRLTSRQFSNGTTNLRIDPGWTNRDQLASLKRYTDLGGTSLVGMSSYTYDAAERLTALTHTYASGSVLASYAYGYDQASRLTSETVNGTQTTYGYDNTDQLTTVNGVTTYSYDLNGNRTMTGYSTQAGNEMTNDGTFTYTYDNEGNLTQKSKGAGLETWYYGYDSLNRMTSVRKTSDGSTNQVTATYTYDVFGNRIEQDEWVKPGSGNGVTTVTRFAYDGSNVWADLNSSNALTMRRLYLDIFGQPFARVDSANNAAWYTLDHLGSVRDISNASGGSDLDRLVYGAYGQVTSETAPTDGDRYGYAGGERDPYTGLDHFGARYINPTTGTWTSRDPSGYAAGDANLYRYVSDTPTNATDPTGLIQWKLWYTDSSPPEGGWYGAFAWGIKWDLKPKLETHSGMIIQQIQITYDVKKVTITGQVITSEGFVPPLTSEPFVPSWTQVGKLTAPMDYLEAWRVVDGTIDPAAFTFPQWKRAQQDGLFNDGEPPASNDWWVKPRAAEDVKKSRTEGRIQMDGWAYYFDGLSPLDLGKNPPSGKFLGFGVGDNPDAGLFNPCWSLPWLQIDANTSPRVTNALGGAAKNSNRSEGVHRKLVATWELFSLTSVETNADSVSDGFPHTVAPPSTLFSPLLPLGGFGKPSEYVPDFEY